jgi:hypothetical protein
MACKKGETLYSDVLLQVITEAEETVDALNIIDERSCVLCQVIIEAEERVFDLISVPGTNIGRTEAKETVVDLNVKRGLIFSKSSQQNGGECC